VYEHCEASLQSSNTEWKWDERCSKLTVVQLWSNYAAYSEQDSLTERLRNAAQSSKPTSIVQDVASIARHLGEELQHISTLENRLSKSGDLAFGAVQKGECKGIDPY
jgi:hypothetical protein